MWRWRSGQIECAPEEHAEEQLPSAQRRFGQNRQRAELMSHEQGDEQDSDAQVA